MKISIAMATFNGEKYLREQLNSLAAQTLLPNELVVTDDGSTDSTIFIIQEFSRYSPFPVRLFVNTNRLGFADNFLKAAKLCDGDWIAFCDQDDFWLPNKLERCAEEFNNPSIVFITHSGTVVNEDLNPLGWRVPDFYKSCTRERLHGDPWGVFAGFSTLVKRDILNHIDSKMRPAHPYLPGDRQSHDRWVYFLAFIFGDTAFISDSLVLYRQHLNNTYGVKKVSRLNSFNAGLASNYEFLLKMLHSTRQHKKLIEEYVINIRAPWQDLAYSAVDFYHNLQMYMISRVEIHRIDNNFLKRSRSFFSNVFLNAYRPVYHGGLGKKALLKDILMCVFSGALMNKIAGIKFKHWRLTSNTESKDKI